MYWLGQVTTIWEGRKGFHASVEKEPSMYRLPELVAENIPLLGRYNLVVGLIEKTSASPPSPMTPPSYPAFPPRGGNNSSVNGLLPLMIYLLVAVGVLLILTITYHKCYRKYRKSGAKVKEEVHNPFTSRLKAEQAEQVAQEQAEMIQKESPDVWKHVWRFSRRAQSRIFCLVLCKGRAMGATVNLIVVLQSEDCMLIYVLPWLRPDSRMLPKPNINAGRRSDVHPIHQLIWNCVDSREHVLCLRKTPSLFLNCCQCPLWLANL